jgi:hypothetical protein
MGTQSEVQPMKNFIGLPSSRGNSWSSTTSTLPLPFWIRMPVHSRYSWLSRADPTRSRVKLLWGPRSSGVVR